MKLIDAVAALSALAQPSRLEVFRLFVRTGEAGCCAGEIAEQLAGHHTRKGKGHPHKSGLFGGLFG